VEPQFLASVGFADCRDTTGFSRVESQLSLERLDVDRVGPGRVLAESVKLRLHATEVGGIYKIGKRVLAGS
jgi:hypothetical protein